MDPNSSAYGTQSNMNHTAVHNQQPFVGLGPIMNTAPVNIMINNGSLTERPQMKKRKPSKQDRVVQRIYEKQKMADSRIQDMQRKKEMETKYKVMQSKPMISSVSKSMIRNTSSFVERSGKEQAEKQNRLKKLQEKYVNVVEEKELTFQPNAALRERQSRSKQKLFANDSFSVSSANNSLSQTRRGANRSMSPNQAEAFFYRNKKWEENRQRAREQQNQAKIKQEEEDLQKLEMDRKMEAQAKKQRIQKIFNENRKSGGKPINMEKYDNQNFLDRQETLAKRRQQEIEKKQRQVWQAETNSKDKDQSQQIRSRSRNQSNTSEPAVFMQ